MWWGLCPKAPVQPAVSREHIRMLCEPFFEQMITDLQRALQTPMHEHGEAEVMQTLVETTKSACFQAVFQSTSLPLCQARPVDPMFDEESTDADDYGAFASLFSNPSSESEGCGAVEFKAHKAFMMSPPTPGFFSSEDSPLSGDSEKSSMVCRHWRSKGWCRLESNCKFLHPEHKCGVSAPNAGSNAGGVMSRAECPDISTIQSRAESTSTYAGVIPVMLARRKKRGGKNRSTKGQQEPAALQASSVHSPRFFLLSEGQ